MVSVITAHPVASMSVDHLAPRGTKDDNTTWPFFTAACERIYGRKVRYLDLGCAGGGQVYDFIRRGHTAYGIEGSDFSKNYKRAAWAYIPDNLFTADIGEEFSIVDSLDQRVQFDVISAWEVLEHLDERQLRRLAINIVNHLAPGGIFVASVSQFQDTVDGVDYHATLQEKRWWTDLFEHEAELREVNPSPFSMYEYVRGIGSGGPDCSYLPVPLVAGAAMRKGFHLVLK